MKARVKINVLSWCLKESMADTRWASKGKTFAGEVPLQKKPCLWWPPTSHLKVQAQRGGIVKRILTGGADNMGLQAVQDLIGKKPVL